MPARKKPTKVYVVSVKGRDNLVLKWTDPATGKTRWHTTNTRKRREAEREAAILENQLSSSIAEFWEWGVALDSLELGHLDSLRQKSAARVITSLTSYEAVMHPKTMEDLTLDSFTAYVSQCRRNGLAEITIQSNLRHVRFLMEWVHARGGGPAPPAMPKFNLDRNRMARGRGLTSAELARGLRQFSVMFSEPNHAAAWRWFVRGLALTGLRVQEALALRWDPGNWPYLSADLRTMVIPADFDKARVDRVLPLVPAFTRLAERHRHSPGNVFHPVRPSGHPADYHYSYKGVSRAFKDAGVIVDPVRNRHATAHDLRRTFAMSLASHLTEKDLSTMMRHQDPRTTRQFYLYQEIEGLAERLREKK